MKTLLINNYDSFSYNIFQMVAKVNGAEPDVFENDLENWQKINFALYDNIIISPGPGHPDNESDFGICKKIITTIDKPILGICLGHQGIASLFGGKVLHADTPVHGQVDNVSHNHSELFANIPERFKVVRYHSFIVAPELSADLEAICWNDENIIMGLKHKSLCIYGVQFHPESICSEYGEQLFHNFNQITAEFYAKNHTYALKFVTQDFSAESAELFTELYKKDKQAIWLDSNIKENEMSQLSIIALSRGPFSYSLKYSIKENAIQIMQGNARSLIADTNIFDYLASELASIRINAQGFPYQFQCGFVGYLGYELKQVVLPVQNKHDFSLPDAQFLFCDRAILIDHQHNQCYLLALDLNDQAQDAIADWFAEIKNIIAKLSNQIKPTNFDNEYILDISAYLEMNRAEYLQAIDECINHIRNGESYEICLTNRIEIKKTIDALAYYLILRRTNPAPYAAFLAFDDCHVACASVERFLKIDADGWIETKPIKGTLPRKQNVMEDEQMIYALQNQIKFKSENLMIVDLLRNDLGHVCEIGSIHVPKLMAVESYKTLHQLVSTIRGKKKPTVTAIDCIKACFPGGSMTGAPKLRTLEIIDELEISSRGIYSGAIGYLSLNGSVDLNIVIRTAVITQNKFSVAVGGAIIALSDPVEEYEEILLKSNSLMKALSAYLNATSVRQETSTTH